MTITVLVPDEYGMAALSAVDGVRTVRYQVGEAWPADAARAQVLVPKFLTLDGVAAMLAELPALEYVQLLSAGAERWIGQVPDGVLLSTCRGAHGGSTAEQAIGGLVAMYRDFPRLLRAQDRGEWDYHRTDTLQGKRLLVIGAGDLGAQMSRRLTGWDCSVTLVGRTARDGVHGVDELPALLGSYDAVILMVPQTSETYGMVDAAFLARMADDAILVNVARGAVVDTDALVAELSTGRLRAILDVTEPEPLPPDHPLWKMNGLILFPHVGGSCDGLDERSWRVAADEIARYARGEQPRNLVHGEY